MSTEKDGTINIDGRVYAVKDVHPLEQITPQLAAHMKARGFDAYGYVNFPRGGNAIAYRAANGRQLAYRAAGALVSAAPGFVMHDGYRWKVAGVIELDGEPAYDLVRPVPGGKGTRSLLARASECAPWRRPAGTRTIRGEKPHRKGRPVVFEYDQQTGVITLRLKRARSGFTTTLEGLFDMCARQQASNLKRDREFTRRIRKGTR
jgi:hypothetical protein